MTLARRCAVTFLVPWLLLGLLNIRLHAFEDARLDLVNVGRTLHIMRKYPLELIQAVRRNNVRFCADSTPGSRPDVGILAQNCVNDLPPTGGTAVLDFEGPQTLNTTITILNPTVHLMVGATNITCKVQ